MSSPTTAIHQPCDDCGSSDALVVFADGGTFCHSCGAHHGIKDDDIAGKAPFLRGDVMALKARGLYEETCKRYGYVVAEHNGKKVQVAPYHDPKTGRLVAQKVRDKDKNFTITGDAKKMGLFGIQLARRGGKMIVITEGEIDALSASQAMGNTWPCLSLPNGAGNLKALKDSLEFLETYEKVVLCFDQDEPGEKAIEEALDLFSPGKAHVVNLGDYKDANEMLKADPKGLRQAIWEAKQYRPDGVVSLSEIKERIQAPLEMGTPYPWPRINELTYGFRPGELVTWCAGTGIGKTAFVAETAYDLLVKHERNLGVIFLEENIVRTGRRFMGIHLNKPIHLPNNEVSDEDFEKAWNGTLGTGRISAWDHFGSVDIELLLNRMRYMRHAYGVDAVVLDHVSMVVSGSDLSADERRLLDKVVTDIKCLAEETGMVVHMVSHLRRVGGKPHEEGGKISLQDLRGSQAIAQLSDTVIGLERDQQAETPAERNRTTLRVLKCRYTGLTGPADVLEYQHDTGRLVALDMSSESDNPEEDY